MIEERKKTEYHVADSGTGKDASVKSKPVIGRNIAAAREMKHFTQRQLSTETGISQASLSSYENNKIEPSLHNLGLIAQALGVTMDSLYFGDAGQSITSRAATNGEVIVSAVKALWDRGVARFASATESSLGHIQISRCAQSICRLIDELNEFDIRRGTYPNPDAYLRQVLGSIINEINATPGSRSWKR